MKMDCPDHLPGLREVLTGDYGRGLDCDGVFLDTVDTAAPNSYTNASSPVESEFEWTAPGFGAFIRKVHEQYPNKLILQNRGLFFSIPVIRSTRTTREGPSTSCCSRASG